MLCIQATTSGFSGTLTAGHALLLPLLLLLPLPLPLPLRHSSGW